MTAGETHTWSTNSHLPCYAEVDGFLMSLPDGFTLSPVSGADREYMGLGDHRHHVEVEAVQGLAGQELGFGEMAREVLLGPLVSVAGAAPDIVPAPSGMTSNGDTEVLGNNAT